MCAFIFVVYLHVLQCVLYIQMSRMLFLLSELAKCATKCARIFFMLYAAFVWHSKHCRAYVNINVYIHTNQCTYKYMTIATNLCNNIRESPPHIRDLCSEKQDRTKDYRKYKFTVNFFYIRNH